ncbi:MAG: hypothetical protein L6R42_004325 [Xanthoria sp. 1 TBL-2021]|nr:MAG: hypothetical protein L6R42_004325 [Xanthoria sp. 1 TBL-2021]
MDDLSGLNWTSSGPDKPKAPSFNQVPSYPSLRPTPPISGRSSPFPAPQQTKPPPSGIARSSTSTPANDSFANLVSFSAANGNSTLSLQEQQKRLQEERARQYQGNNASQSGQQDEEFWEKLGSGTSTPNPNTSPPPYAATADYGGHVISKALNKPYAGIDMRPKRPTQPPSQENDLLSGFGAAATDSEAEEHRITLEDNTRASYSKSKQVASSTLGNVHTSVADDDDILGLLGRPVSEFAQPEPQPQLPTLITANKADQALAELVDMGFDVEKSKRALEATDTGADVQSAVGWLLNQAHQESTKRSRVGEVSIERSQSRQSRMSPPRRRSPANEGAQPAWMRDPSQGGAGQQRQNSRSPINGENPSKIAAELGTNLFKTANSIWKTGTKKLNQAVAEINSDSDSSQPKWMRERDLRANKAKQTSRTSQGSAVDGRASQRAGSGDVAAPIPDVTDEALMLECTDARPPPRNPSRSKPETDSNGHEYPSPSPSQQDLHRPRFLKQPAPQVTQNAGGRLSRQVIEEQMAEAYISPARRKKTTPKPPASEPDLLFGASEVLSKPSVAPAISKPSSQPSTQLLATSIPRQSDKAIPRPSPRVPKRNIPPISPSALRSSHTSRQAGTASFKRGDYSEAATHYSSALAPLPPTHPLSVPLLTNRALSHLKTGDPKNCIADCNTALDLIGPTRGVGETIDLGDEGNKDMFTYWGKAMTRQAEALEQLERWADAGVAWKTCVEAGVGGATSIAGRNRCDKVVKGPGIQNLSSTTPRPTVPKKPPHKPRPKTSALDDLSGTSASTTALGADSAEAVTRLRAANVEAERLDDERFALSDKVSERVGRWRNGKEGNLRALLASLDTVLWEGSGWKKVGMGELILAGKVKVVYMKGIGKVHPDKLPTTATTEQRMISAAVFATLNEAWDGFKKENGL